MTPPPPPPSPITFERVDNKIFKFHPLYQTYWWGVYDQNFYGGRGSGWEGGTSERCLKWGGGDRGSLRDLSKNILKTEGG